MGSPGRSRALARFLGLIAAGDPSSHLSVAVAVGLVEAEGVVEEAGELLGLPRHGLGRGLLPLVGVSQGLQGLGDFLGVGSLEDGEAPEVFDGAVPLPARRLSGEEGLDVLQSPLLLSEGLLRPRRAFVALPVEPGQEGLALLVGLLARLVPRAAGLLEGGLGVHEGVEAEDLGEGVVELGGCMSRLGQGDAAAACRECGSTPQGAVLCRGSGGFWIW